MKGLSLEQIDTMLEETTPRKSGSWKPHGTFASQMGLTEKGHGVSITATQEEVHRNMSETSKV